MKAVDPFAFLIIDFNLLLRLVFQIVYENLAADWANCDSEAIMTESDWGEGGDLVISLGIDGFDIFLRGNVEKLDLSIVSTTCQKKIVHRGKSYPRAWDLGVC